MSLMMKTMEDNQGSKKHSISWKIGTVLSFFIYYSGISAIYRFIRLSIFHKSIAIALTYHRIDKNTIDHMTALQSTFDNQLAYLSNYFKVISLDDFINYTQIKKWTDGDLATITFDDGYRDTLSIASPILLKYKLPATVFITTGWTGTKDMLTTEEIRELKRQNFTIGAHTVTHPRLSQLSRNEIHNELLESRKTLEKILNEKINFFAYPKGKSADVGTVAIESAIAVGFKAAFSTENGIINKTSNIFFLPRLGIRDIPLFVFKVRVSGIFESFFFRSIRKLLGLT
jgi:peptidoglycan/xylan/chitin deacetylase (PgdA/CDA1 family)